LDNRCYAMSRSDSYNSGDRDPLCKRAERFCITYACIWSFHPGLVG